MSDTLREFSEKVTWLRTAAPFNLSTALGMEFTVLEPTMVTARMEVLDRVKQPFGLLHGGATVALIESVASIGAWLNIPKTAHCVGIEVNANHLRAMTSGWIIGTARPLHRGQRTQVWGVDVTEEAGGKLVATGRCTLMVLHEAS